MNNNDFTPDEFKPVTSDTYRKNDFSADEFLDNPNSESGYYDPESGLSAGSGMARALTQIPVGIAQGATYALDLMNLIGTGDALSNLEELKETHPEFFEKDPDFEKKYLDALEEASSHFPTISNYEEAIEKKTGIPIVAKNRLERLIRLGGTAGKISPAGILKTQPGQTLKNAGKQIINRVPAAITAPVVSGAANLLGASEPVSDIIGLLAANFPGAATSLIKRSRPSKQAANLEADILRKTGGGGEPPGGGGNGGPPNIPNNPRPTKEKALQELIENEKANIKPPEPIEEARQWAAEYPNPKNSPSLEGRKINPMAEKRLGLEVSLPHAKANYSNVISPYKFKSSSIAGEDLKEAITTRDSSVYRGVNQLYDRSKELQKGISTIHTELVEELQPMIKEIEKIPHPSAPEQQKLAMLKNIDKKLVKRSPITDESGNVIGEQIDGYLPIESQDLINQIQSINFSQDFDFTHGTPKGLFKPVKNALDKAVINAAKQTGNQEAIIAHNMARQGYSDWANTFDSDYLRPWRNVNNKDYSKLYKGSLDIDEARYMKNVLDLTPEGEVLSNTLVREVVEKNLNKYFEKPFEFKLSEFNKALNEVEPLLTEAEVSSLKQQYNDKRKTTSARIKKHEMKPELKPEEKVAAKYLDKKPEDIDQLMNSITGFRELKEGLSKTTQQKEVYNQLKLLKTRSMLRDGNINKKATGKDLKRVLNKEENYPFFVEFLGEEEAAKALQSAEKIGDKILTPENLSKFALKSIIYKAVAASIFH